MKPRMPFPVFEQTWSLGVEEQFYLLWPLPSLGGTGAARSS